MNKFNIGDKVKSKYGPTGVVAGFDSGFVLIKRDDGIIGGRWRPFWGYEPYELETTDDPLPPAPEGGMYFSHNNSRVATLKLEPDAVALGVTGTNLKVRLTPETALVMAHDLRRMAMDLQRKQKQENE